LDRPASAIKELIENSLDAKASKIDIFVRDGGRTEIKVVDDGVGMSPEELTLSVQRHATSKLNDENLFAIKTFGFRGEALPSIASISKFKIISKKKKDSFGFEILINAGNKISSQPCVREVGTTVIIKDIFFSTPARLKFLKSERYENVVIKRTVQRLALANISVEFNLFNEEKYKIAEAIKNS
jgi:DNA mismatch repair protein MutL